MLSQLGLVAYGALQLVHDKYGEGIHQWDIPFAEMRMWAKVGWTEEKNRK